MPVRVLLKETGEEGFVNVKASSISVTLNRVPVFTFDLEGRLLFAYMGDRTFARGLDNRVLEKRGEWTVFGRHRVRREVEGEEKRALLNGIHRRIERVLQALQAGAIIPLGEPAPDALSQAARALKKIASYDHEALEADRRRFFSIYKPVTILPPDQYLTLVLQATEGCPYNQCSFCHFYKGRPFRVKTEEEFKQHILAVKAFFGEALKLRRSLFLGDANALVAPQERLLRFFDLANEAFPASTGIYAFMDAFSARKPSKAFEALARRNLKRVYIGVETGHEELLKLLNKPGSAEEAKQVIISLKEGGTNVGVIIMLGIGGNRYVHHHVEQTVRLLNALPLGEGDLLYFSPLVEHPGSEYAKRAAALGIGPLTEEEMREQGEAIKAGLRFAGPSRPKLSTYDIREFLY
ncbi:MAG: radical SAM protein [candidate division NC10 bacterium]|nr:radical SAM protein [candidate division NC10 bacterium]